VKLFEGAMFYLMPTTPLLYCSMEMVLEEPFNLYVDTPQWYFNTSNNSTFKKKFILFEYEFI
jgi:1,4-alpha-glucan branching enzyme